MSRTDQFPDSSKGSRRSQIPVATRHSVYCFATDVRDEGADVVLSNLQERAGVDGVTMAVKYHMARDVYPHNPKRRVASVGAGVYYHPALQSYADEALIPTIAPAAQGQDVLGELCRSASRCNMSVGAWIVLLHSDEADIPAAVMQHNCFGEVAGGTLCPAHAGVVRYCRQMVEEICNYPIDVLRAESAHFHGLDHGHHHERLLEEIDPVALFLLGLCFCESCIVRAELADIDGERLRETVKYVVAGVFSDRDLTLVAKDEELSPEILMRACGGAEILSYLDVRERSVAAFQQEIAMVAARAGKRITFIDLTVSEGARSPGVIPTEMGAVMSRLKLGTHLPRKTDDQVCFELAGYLTEPRDLKALLASYGGGGLNSRVPSLILRPGSPDCDGTDNLAAKVALAKSAGCVEVSFYNYGLYRLDVLDRIRSAIAS